MSTAAAAPSKSIADHGIAAAAGGLERLVSVLPFRATQAAGRAIGLTCDRGLRYRRDIVRRQIAESFPDASPDHVESIARGCYRHFGQELAVLAGGATAIKDALGRISDDNESGDRLRAAVRDRGGAVVVTGHLGNWELGGARIASFGVPTIAVARRPSGAGDRRISAMRARLGFEVAYDDTSPRSLIRRLRSGHVLALVADQHPPRGGERLDFLGRPAWTTVGPARLCQTADVPLFFAALLRDGNGYQTVFEEIEPASDDGGDAPIALTRKWLRVLEGGVRARPEQYFWFHRRWKPARGRGRGNAGGGDSVRIDMEHS